MTYRRKRKKERESGRERYWAIQLLSYHVCYRCYSYLQNEANKFEAEIELKNYESIDNDTTGTNCAVIDGVVSLEDYIIINFPEVIVNAKLEIIGSGQENVRNA